MDCPPLRYRVGPNAYEFTEIPHGDRTGRRIAGSGITVTLELLESFERLPLDTETALFRNFQESLINIHRHAESETAGIRLRRDAEALVLEIEDRGRGIPSTSLRQIMGGGDGAGVGIASMCERVEQLGGSLENTSGDSGTTVHAQLPLGKDAA